jgi:hypothetical protein
MLLMGLLSQLWAQGVPWEWSERLGTVEYRELALQKVKQMTGLKQELVQDWLEQDSKNWQLVDAYMTQSHVYASQEPWLFTAKSFERNFASPIEKCIKNKILDPQWLCQEEKTFEAVQRDTNWIDDLENGPYCRARLSVSPSLRKRQAENVYRDLDLQIQKSISPEIVDRWLREDAIRPKWIQMNTELNKPLVTKSQVNLRGIAGLVGGSLLSLVSLGMLASDEPVLVGFAIPVSFVGGLGFYNASQRFKDQNALDSQRIQYRVWLNQALDQYAKDSVSKYRDCPQVLSPNRVQEKDLLQRHTSFLLAEKRKNKYKDLELVQQYQNDLQSYRLVSKKHEALSHGLLVTCFYPLISPFCLVGASGTSTRDISVIKEKKLMKDLFIQDLNAWEPLPLRERSFGPLPGSLP